MFKEFYQLLLKDIRMELRQRYAIGSVFLYVLSTIFVAYLSFHKIVAVPVWNALFWIIVLFASFNAMARSFAGEAGGRHLYLYTLARPEAVIFSKMVYNLLLMGTMVLVSLGVYVAFLGDAALANINWIGFILTMLSGSAGLAAVLTMIAAIASQTSNNPGLMAILGLPVVIPLLLVLLRLSKNMIDGIAWSVNAPYAVQLTAIIGLVLGLSYILFPYLWRE